MPKALPAGTRAEAVLEALPGKKPLIKLTYRPPNYESPVSTFRTAITPNDSFFVRYHLSDIPNVDAKTWRLAVGGDGANGRVELSLDDLKALPSTEVIAVCQCSGNRRGLFEPHVVGVEWGYGAMGCARWKGARLKDVLDPEKKRKIIGATFIDVFESEDVVRGARFLGQGTLYPDVIESVSFKGPSAVIKSHHNVGGLPERMKLELIEPLRRQCEPR